MLKFFDKINTEKLKIKKLENVLKERVPKITYKNQKNLANNLEDLNLLNYLY